MSRKLAEALGERLEMLLHKEPDQEAAMDYAEDRMYEAGLLPAIGLMQRDSPLSFSRDLISENPLVPDWLNLQPMPKVRKLQSVAHLIEELTACPRD